VRHPPGPEAKRTAAEPTSAWRHTRAPKDEDALKDEQIKKLKQKVGELVRDLDILKEASRTALLLRRRRTSEGGDAADLRASRVSSPGRRPQ
jgi:CHAD domain-containing protein